MIARIYTRVSSAKQSDGASLEVQLTACRQYATLHGFAVASEHTDILSGTRDDRPAYNQMRAAMQPSDLILVWRMDRIGRKNSELFRFFEECKQAHVGLVSVTQPEMSSELARNFLAIVASFESQQNAARVRPAMASRAADGRWVGRVPFGYRLPAPHDPDYAGGHLVPSADAATVRAIFAAYLRSGNYDTLAVAFHRSVRSIRYTLTNEAYRGVLHWSDTRVPDAHPPLIDPATWAAVQTLRQTRAKRNTHHRPNAALLTGLLHFEDTRYRMYHNTARGRGTMFYATRSFDPTVSGSVYAAVAERAVLDDLRSLTLAPAARRAYERDLARVARHDPHKRTRDDLARHRARLRTGFDRITLAYARGLLDETALATARRTLDHESALMDAEERALPPLPDLAAATPLLNLRVGLAATVDAMEARNDRLGLRRLIESLFVRIEAWECRKDGLARFARRDQMRAHPPRIVCHSVLHDLG